MKCPLDVHRKARGHKRCAVPAKDEGKTGWGFIYPELGPSTVVEVDRDLGVPMSKEVPGRHQKRSQ